jgi:DNA-binding MarR family transcriptional regulator
MDRSRSFGFLLARTYRFYVQRFEQRASELGLTLSQCRVLVQLAQHEGMSQAELAELANIEPMTLVRILDRMESDSWVERRHDPADRRARRLYLKPRGRPLLEKIWRLSDATREEAFAGILHSQAELLISLLEKINDNLAALEPLPPSSAPAGSNAAAMAASSRTRRERSTSKT